MEFWTIIIAIIVVFWGLASLSNYYTTIRLNRLSDLKKREADSREAQRNADNELQKTLEEREGIRRIALEKSKGFPWLSEAFADYLKLRDDEVAEYLIYKPHPARKASEHVREISLRRRRAEKLHRVLKYKLRYYENLFPWLVDFSQEDVDDLIEMIMTPKALNEAESDIDPVEKWVTAGEYKKLSVVERNQLALNRYWSKKKTPWEIGRDYERYVGFLYEKQGYSVFYQGIIKGLSDLGRDLIVTKGNTVEIVQCKCWSMHKTIHEKHIFQLYGTTIEYYLKNLAPSSSAPTLFDLKPLETGALRGTFYTSTALSDMARKFASVLKIQIHEQQPLQEYPSVKCNVSRKTNEKIYHLPFDQQYDKVLVEEERNECYVTTVREAEDLGFRRAYRWRGPKDGE